MYSGTPTTQPTVVPDGEIDTIPAIMDAVKISPQELPGILMEAVRLDVLHPTWLPLTYMATADNGGAETMYFAAKAGDDWSSKVPPDATISNPPLIFWPIHPTVEPPVFTAGLYV